MRYCKAAMEAIMALKDNETPIHIQKTENIAEPLPCDYIDVAVSDDDQPHFTLRPHRSGGSPIGSALVLEIEGIRALSAKLAHILGNEGKTG
jgi:hypothetical protein